ncbi:GH25 family lysozyme [Phytohabitans sp. LJ34]|uniref:GH25 family lysozyme n=1 Tax=Phytohabitans sp. LJ34 TaxID=3452217 RepID=UPI003F8BB793
MPVFTIDVSHHDWAGRVEHGLPGQIGWAKASAAGIQAMCARATYGDPQGSGAQGTFYDTRHFGDFAQGAKSAGFALRGGYHNLVRGDQSSINRQVDFFRSELDRHDANWAMLDVERYEELLAHHTEPRFDDVRRFDDRWAAVESRVLAIYLPHWVWDGHLGAPSLTQLRGPLVSSNYGDNQTLPTARLYDHRGGDDGNGWKAYGGKTPALWQFGSRALVPGVNDYPHRKHDANGKDIDRGTDINAFRGTFAELRMLLTGEDEDDVTLEEMIKVLAGFRGEGKAVTAGGGIFIQPHLAFPQRALNEIQAARTEIVGLTAAVQHLAEVVAAGTGTNPEALKEAVRAAIDERLPAISAAVQDAIDDEDEGVHNDGANDPLARPDPDAAPAGRPVDS